MSVENQNQAPDQAQSGIPDQEQAENDLLAAFMADAKGEGADEGAPQNTNQADDPEQAAKAAEEEGDEASNKDGAEGDPEGDYVEDGAGNKFAVDDLLAAHEYKKQTEASLEQLRHQAIQQGQQHVAAHQQHFQQAVSALEQSFKLVQTLIPEMQPPPTSMLDPNSQDYDPHGYHFLERNQRELTARIQQAQQVVQGAQQEARRQQAAQQEQLAAQSAARLKSKYPEAWGTPEAATAKWNELTSFAGKSYGIEPQLIGSIVHPGFWEALMDAHAFRTATAKGLPKPSGAEKSSPRLVRTSAKAPAGKPGANGVATNRKQAAEAHLKKTGKVSDPLAIFGDYL